MLGADFGATATSVGERTFIYSWFQASVTLGRHSPRTARQLPRTREGCYSLRPGPSSPLQAKNPLLEAGRPEPPQTSANLYAW